MSKTGFLPCFFEKKKKKGLYKPQKTIYNANENKEKQHNLQKQTT